MESRVSATRRHSAKVEVAKLFGGAERMKISSEPCRSSVGQLASLVTCNDADTINDIGNVFQLAVAWRTALPLCQRLFSFALYGTTNPRQPRPAKLKRLAAISG